MHCKPDDTTISQKIKETISELTYFDYRSNRIMRKFELYYEHLMLYKK